MTKLWLTLLFFCALSLKSISWQDHNNLDDTSFKRFANQEAWVDSVANSLTLDEKIAQFFMLGVYPTQGEANRSYVENVIKKYNIGGIIIFKGHPLQVAQWNNSFQKVAKTPLFISVDGEWGINMRLDSTIQYPRQLTLGAIQDDDLIYKMGQQIALECKAVGININLAPDMDINNNINNPVINDRSFGEDKYNVALKALAYAQGMQSQNVMAVGKHFPGHGDTDTDSHKDMPVIKHSKARLDSIELYPFKVAVQNEVKGIMVAHLNIPALDNTENLPSSLSKKIITDLLKTEMGFNGLVFSDALNMKGVTKYYEPGEVDKIAFLAGTDVLVVSEDIPKGIEMIKKAIKKGDITEQYINERLKKVLENKYWLQLDKSPIVDVSKVNSVLNLKTSKELNKQLFEKALTIAVNDNFVIPLKNGQEKNTIAVALGTSYTQTFQKTLEPYSIKNSMLIPNDIAIDKVKTYTDKLKPYDKVIVSIHNMSRWKSKNYGFSAGELQFLNEINKTKEVVLVVFGSPYSLSLLQDFKTILVAYEDNSYTQEVAAKALFAKTDVNGKLPVSAGKFKVGTGYNLSTEKNIKHTAPEDMGMDSKILDSIDYYAKKAIKIEATPGCQIVVLKDGNIVYDKSFGYTTYTSNSPINSQTIYDLASITKVAATTLAIMKLYENDKIDLNQSLKHYLPNLKGTSVGNLVIKNIMAHQAGLPSWIPFYKATVEDSVYNNWYRVDSNAAYCVKVADNLFMCKDSLNYIWKTIDGVEIKENPDYRYSDLGFYLLMEVVEKQSGMSLDGYVSKYFYEPMELKNIGFNPYNKFDLSRIPPTENDTIFRKQVVQGYVHDPGAAMLGGVCGHAGLFSNAIDLAELFQMLNNGGTYNGIRYLKEKTINYFNSVPFKDDDNRRALGFDKPVLPNKKTGIRKGGPTAPMVSDKCFGHTGFTGTAVWADPEYNLVYVFLSNRTYPYATTNTLAKENIRTDIQEVIYRAIKHSDVN